MAPRIDARATRARIVAAASRAAGEGSLPSLAGVAAAAGISRATLHRHFPTRAALLAEIDAPTDPDTRDRVLEAAASLLEEVGLAGLSLETVAERAGVSRAAAYRLFPGRAALFRALVAEMAPFDEVAALLDAAGDQPPEVLVPKLLGTIARRLGDRPGLMRSLMLEFTGSVADAGEGREAALGGGLARAAAYLAGQMAAGRLRPMHPLLALQALVGPLLMHVITRQQAELRFPLGVTVTEAAAQFAAAWLRAMEPEGGSDASHASAAGDATGAG